METRTAGEDGTDTRKKSVRETRENYSVMYRVTSR